MPTSANGYHDLMESSPVAPRTQVDLRPPPVECRRRRIVRWWRSRGRHRGVRYWLLTLGMPIFLLYVGLYLSNGIVIGWTASYNVMIGITSPGDTVQPILAWFLSFAGWLLAPGIAGAVAGYVVSNSIASRRLRPLGTIFASDGNHE